MTNKTVCCNFNDFHDANLFCSMEEVIGWQRAARKITHTYDILQNQSYNAVKYNTALSQNKMLLFYLRNEIKKRFLLSSIN